MRAADVIRIALLTRPQIVNKKDIDTASLATTFSVFTSVNHATFAERKNNEKNVLVNVLANFDILQYDNKMCQNCYNTHGKRVNVVRCRGRGNGNSTTNRSVV